MMIKRADDKSDEETRAEAIYDFEDSGRFLENMMRDMVQGGMKRTPNAPMCTFRRFFTTCDLQVHKSRNIGQPGKVWTSATQGPIAKVAPPPALARWPTLRCPRWQPLLKLKFEY
eukprot:363135-Chlamydomonas_euryale.AAC.2